MANTFKIVIRKQSLFPDDSLDLLLIFPLGTFKEILRGLRLISLFSLAIVIRLSSSTSFSRHSTRTASTQGRFERKVDVLLRVELHKVRRNIDVLLADPK